VQSILNHVDAATAGPELRHAVKELDQTLTHFDHLAAAAEPQIQPLLSSLRATVQAAQRTVEAANGELGNGASSGDDLPHLIRELTEAARSIRDLSSFLDRHPEALIRGRKAEKP
jgi:paraquat-inducible protein B